MHERLINVMPLGNPKLKTYGAISKKELIMSHFINEVNRNTCLLFTKL